VDRAQVALGETELRAPFDGVVAAVNPVPGEQLLPGVVAVQLADAGGWQIETDDLTELNVGRFKEGGEVTLVFDAIPDLALTGRIVRIRPIGENKRGDITYTAIITPSQQDNRLKWNMTATVAIKGN
jgi:HlyD family secretion protein